MKEKAHPPSFPTSDSLALYERVCVIREKWVESPSSTPTPPLHRFGCDPFKTTLALLWDDLTNTCPFFHAPCIVEDSFTGFEVLFLINAQAPQQGVLPEQPMSDVCLMRSYATFKDDGMSVVVSPMHKERFPNTLVESLPKASLERVRQITLLLHKGHSEKLTTRKLLNDYSLNTSFQERIVTTPKPSSKTQSPQHVHPEFFGYLLKNLLLDHCEVSDKPILRPKRSM